MHLLNARTRSLEYFIGYEIPPYAILSHTWGEDEVSMQDLSTPEVHLKEGSTKIVYTCEQALKDGLGYAWIDTCCIDKTSSAELSEAINSMYNWYSRAEVCYAYLDDVMVHTEEGLADGLHWINCLPNSLNLDPRGGVSVGFFVDSILSVIPGLSSEVSSGISSLLCSRWFTRGWTLQELIAPKDVIFFGKGWERLGRRDKELLPTLSNRTGIDQAVLEHRSPVSAYSIAQRMSWSAYRETTRREDEAYCLLGLFGVNMPLLYGEEDKAFQRLQEEILRGHSDHSIFAWDLLDSSGSDSVPGSGFSLTAPSPRCFRYCRDVMNVHRDIPHEPLQMTKSGLTASMPLIKGTASEWIGVLQCHLEGSYLGLWLSSGNEETPAEHHANETFCLSRRFHRTVRVDVEDVRKANITNITIRTPSAQSFPDPHLSRFVNCTVWFRLRNSHTSHFSLRETWPETQWKVFGESSSQYKNGTLLIARFDTRSDSQFGGVVLEEDDSKLRYGICFAATRSKVAYGFEFIELGEQSLQTCCADFRRNFYNQYNPWRPGIKEARKVVGRGCHSVEIKAVMHVESMLASGDIALEVTVDYPNRPEVEEIVNAIVSLGS